MDSQTDAANQLRRIFARCYGGIALSFALSIATTLLGLLKPVYMLTVFTKITPAKSEPSLYWLTLMVVTALVLLGVFNFVRARLMQKMGNWVGDALGVELLEPIIIRTLRGKGDPSETLRDIQVLKTFFSSTSIPTAMEFGLSPLFLMILYLLHPFFAMIVLGFMVVLTILAITNELSSRQITKDAMTATQESNREVSNYLKNAEVVEAMGMQRPVLELWWESNERAVKLSEQATKKAAIYRACTSVVPLMAIVMVLFVGSLLIMSGELGASAGFVAMFATGLALAPTIQLLGSWRSWVEVRISYSRLVDMLEEGEGARSSMPMPAPDGDLVVKDLTFVPPGSTTPVLRGASFRVRPGEAVAVVGSSGAGKSTLARMLVGIWQPTAGMISLDGHSVYTWERESFGQIVGYLPQAVGLFNTTIGMNISRLRPADDSAIIKAATQAGVHNMIGGLKKGYDTELSGSSYSLTGGQRQLIGLARALFGNPRLLVLDEPDANLDTESQMSLVDAIEEAKAGGAMVVVVSHRHNIMAAVDKVLLMHQGQVQAFVTKEQWEEHKGNFAPQKPKEKDPSPRLITEVKD
ncbi:type I secretion system permease/ATPase [Rhodovibrionaceae bacterium A322]